MSTCNSSLISILTTLLLSLPTVVAVGQSDSTESSAQDSTVSPVSAKEFEVSVGLEYSWLTESFNDGELAVTARYSVPFVVKRDSTTARPTGRIRLDFLGERTATIERREVLECYTTRAPLDVARAFDLRSSPACGEGYISVDTVPDDPPRFDSSLVYQGTDLVDSQAALPSWRIWIPMTFEVRLGKTDVWLGAVAAAGFATGGARSDLAEFFQGGLEMSSWDVSGRKMLEFQALVGKTRRFRFREEVSTDEPFSDTEPTTQLQFSLRIEPFDSYQLRILATFADGPDLARLAVLKRIDVAKVLQGIGI